MRDLFGIRIIENPHMTTSHSRRRTWRERLFSRPWRPFMKFLHWEEPSEEIFIVNLAGIGAGKTVIAHPVTAAKIADTTKEARKWE